MNQFLKALVFSGWGQNTHPLFSVVPDGFIAESANYSKYDIENKTCDLVVGWSLGAELALKLVLEKKIKTRALVLLSPPLKLTNSSLINAIGTEVLEDFKTRLQKNSGQTLKEFAMLIGQKNKQKESLDAMKEFDVDGIEHGHWAMWLDYMINDSISLAHIPSLPPTLVIYGDGDPFITSHEMNQLASISSNIKAILINGVAHSLHRRCPEVTKKHIAGWLRHVL